MMQPNASRGGLVLFSDPIAAVDSVSRRIVRPFPIVRTTVR